MTDLTIAEVADTWVNGADGRKGTNYGSTDTVRAESGAKRILLKPSLPNIAGRTVLDAYLVGHSKGTISQTLTVAAIADRWGPGRVTWADQPAVLTGSVSAVVGAAADGAVVTVPGLSSMLQAVADGTPWYGLRVSTGATSAQAFYATESGRPAWSLHVTLSDLTDAPTNLRPNGGAVTTSRPILAWTAEGQVSRRIQVDTPAAGMDPDDVSPDFDTTMQASIVTEFNLATSSHTPAGAGPHYWRVQAVTDGDDAEPEWSDWASFTVAALPSLIIDSPVGPFGDPSPTLTAHLSTGTLSHWKAMVTGPDRADVRSESGLSTGAFEWDVPETKNGRRVVESGGWAYFEAHDTTDRAVAVGQPGFVSAWVELVLNDSGTVDPVESLLVSQLVYGSDPRHLWRWERTEAADAWLLGEGDRVLRRLAPEDVTSLGGGFYEFQDSGEVQPLRPHDLWVKAVEGDQASLPRTRYDQSHEVSGVWLIPDDGEAIQLDGTAVSGFANSEKVATYATLVGPDVDVIYDPNPGRVGAFAGSVDSRQDVWASLDAIEALRVSRTRLARLVWGSQTMKVRVKSPDATSADDILPSTLTHSALFGFVQVGP